MASPSHVDPPPIDYSSRGYSEIRSDGIIMIPLFLTEWTDHNQSDPGIALLGIFAAIEDRLNYYIDRAVNQSSIVTSITRTAAINHAKSLNYTIPGPDAAVVDVTVTRVAGAGLVNIAAYALQFTASNGELFENSAAITVPVGVNIVLNQPFVHGQTIDNNPLAVSTNRADQSYSFLSSPVLDDPIVVSVGGVAWTETNSLPLYDSTDRVYYLQRDDNDVVSVHFGDNVFGAIPALNANIRAQYRIGGGVAGQIEAGAIDENPIFGANTLNFTNPAASSGGGPHESTEDIKVNAPRNWVTQERCVTLNDYEVKAELVSGVGKAQAFASYINIVNIYIAPAGGGTAPLALLNNVNSALDPLKVATDTLVPLSASYVDVIITGMVYVLSSYRNSLVEIACNANVTSLLAFDNREFGLDNRAQGDIKFSNLVQAIENTTGVDYVVLTEFRIDPLVVYDTWNDVLTTVGSIGVNDETIAETWTIQFTSATVFVVTGSVSGTQPTTGVIGTTYISDDSRISLLVTAGGGTMLVGDKAYFRVSRYLATDNVKVMYGEIAQMASGNLNLTYTGGLT